MAHTFNRTRPAGISTGASRSVFGLIDRVVTWNAARRTRKALSQLSAHELEDIGLQRGDIDRIGSRDF